MFLIVASIVAILIVIMILAAIGRRRKSITTAAAGGGDISIDTFPPAAGMDIGEYSIKSKLEESGMSITYMGKDKDRNACLVKIPQPQQLSNNEYMTRFRREAEILGKLNHPNIVKLYKTGSVRNRGTEIPYMILEYIDGKDLGQVMIDEAPVKPVRALKIIRGIAEALQEVHKENVIHRNIKPSSIRLKKNGEVVLLNFGIAKLLGAETITQAGTAMGTAMYMAPEQMGDEKIDLRVDLYALGIIFFRLITGQFPFDARNVPKLVDLKVSSEAPDPCSIIPDTPREVADMVLKLLKKNRDERYDSTASLISDIDRTVTQIGDES